MGAGRNNASFRLSIVGRDACRLGIPPLSHFYGWIPSSDSGIQPYNTATIESQDRSGFQTRPYFVGNRTVNTEP
jgi:hypothetical protein